MRALRRTAQDGFTLVELLVAMTLLGFLTILLFGGLKFGSRAWERSHELTAEENAIRAAQSRLLTAIEHAYPMLQACGANCQSIAFAGEAHALAFLSMADSPDGGMTEVRFALAERDDSAALDITSRSELAVGASEETISLLRQVASLEFAYFGKAAGERAPAWHARWTGQQRLPQIVRVRVAMADHRLTWPAMIVQPRITASVGCVLNRLSHDCQGRP